MKIIIETPGFKASPSMRSFTTDKVSTLSQINDKILKAQVILKHESTVRTEKIFCEIHVYDSGKNLFAKSSSQIFEDAIIKTVNILKRKLRKNKTRKAIPRKKAKQTRRKL